MRAGRFEAGRRAAGIATLALVSAGWTANVAGLGAVVPVVSAETPRPSLPDGTSVPSQAIEAPASVSDPDEASDGGNTQQIVANSSTNAIPSAALAAYQRAETVINAADKTCNITWQLVAAIGRVESNHGRFGGNVLNDQGIAQPGIYGPALNGKQNTTLVADTDAGQYDDDKTYDHAVGPMQFIPSTWSVVGVDADGDGERNPQDIDDAALATAVYLCSGDEDLSTTPGQRASVYRYNHSQSYVDLVLAIADNYLQGDYTSIPDNTIAGGTIPGSTISGGLDVSGVTGPLDDTSQYGMQFRQVLDTFTVRVPRGHAVVAPTKGGQDAGTDDTPPFTAGGGEQADHADGAPGGADSPSAPDPTEPAHPTGDDPQTGPGEQGPTPPQDGEESETDVPVTPEATEVCVDLLELDPDLAEDELLLDPDFVECVEGYALDPTDPLGLTS